jgi:hypothetical protein
MRIWKAVTLSLIVAMAGACAGSETTSDGTSAEAEEKAKVEAAKPVIIPAGTTLSVVLSTSLSSDKNNAGDVFTGNLAEAVVVDGKTILDKGTAVEGKVVSADGAGKVKGVGKLSLTLTGATVGGKAVALETKTHAAEAETTKGKDAAIIGGGAGVGAAIGAIAGGKKGAAIGATVGGGGGTAAVLATKGKEVEYPAESKLTFTLDQEASVTP